MSSVLENIYQIKEEIRNIFKPQTISDEALNKFLEWIETAYKYFPKSSQIICRYMNIIVTFKLPKISRSDQLKNQIN